MRPGQTDKSIAELAVLVNDVHQAHAEAAPIELYDVPNTLPLYEALRDLYQAFNLQVPE